MKATTIKWMIGMVAVMFVFVSNSWADGKRGRGDHDHGPKYQHRHYKDNGHHYKHRPLHRHHRGDRHYRARRHHGPRHYHYYGHRPHRRHYAKGHRHYYYPKAHRVEIKPNPLFWLFPFPPLTPFVYE